MTERPSGAGCVWAMLAINTLIIGFFALSFAQGPYSSDEQELWYRYGSLAFLSSGAILPAIALLLGANRSGWMIGALVAWMAVTFIGFAFYVLMSGGGV